MYLDKYPPLPKGDIALFHNRITLPPLAFSHSDWWILQGGPTHRAELRRPTTSACIRFEASVNLIGLVVHWSGTREEESETDSCSQLSESPVSAVNNEEKGSRLNA